MDRSTWNTKLQMMNTFPFYSLVPNELMADFNEEMSRLNIKNSSKYDIREFNSSHKKIMIASILVECFMRRNNLKKIKNK